MKSKVMEPVSFERLTPEQFEEFSFDLLRNMGFVNLDWRKGTGLKGSPADRGRDIVAELERTDVDGAKHTETWLVECKHQQRAVPVTKLQSLLAWSEAESPTTALFVLSGFLSNASKDYLREYERTRHPSFRIKYWERSTLARLLLPDRAELAQKYALATDLEDESPRTLNDVLAAEQEFFDRVWYDRKVMLLHAIKAKKRPPLDRKILKLMRDGMKEVESRYGKKALGPYSDFEWGMVMGKLSALRWVLGSDWDILDS